MCADFAASTINYGIIPGYLDTMKILEMPPVKITITHAT